ncbi:hypothetical protein DY000_02039009 [Brassica cretica]|uniref:Ubiquitin-like protease family profile domain-containing protein n=1 Tax=Brassica cretica TaxID=69181 RepID=A0ABQ7BHU8_BRACR|nr:hypothetical protein DY000_02039009 [Brassica cretica]
MNRLSLTRRDGDSSSRSLRRDATATLSDFVLSFPVIISRRFDSPRIVSLLFKRSVLVSLCENRVIIEMMLIPAIKLEMMNEEINFNDIVPFQVKKAEGLPKTKLPFNCGLFVVKMLECRSLGLKKMSNINDDTAMDLRSKLCCKMFDLFMDKDFQEGCRR